MNIKFIGVGSAFALQNYNSNMVLATGGKRLLIDAGGDLRHALRDAGLSHKDIDAIYISHLHADHIGGMEYMAFISYFGCQPPRKPALYGRSNVLDGLWSSMKQGVASIQNKIMTMDDYFDVNRVGMNGTFEFGGTKFQTVQAIHVMNGFEVVPSYGLIFQDRNGKKVFVTTDTQFAPHQIKDFYGAADLIFHDCETSPFKSGIHAHYEDLRTLPEETKKKMWLYHYNDVQVGGKLPDAVGDGFAGFVQQGQVFDLWTPDDLK